MTNKKPNRLLAFCSTFLLSLVFWLLITGLITGIWNGLDKSEWEILIAGAAVALIVAAFSARFFIHESPFYLLRPDRLLLLIFYCLIIFPWELIKANTAQALRAFRPKLNIRPGIVKVPVSLTSEYGLAMLADSITLTPGTITLDIVEEGGRHYYYIHWINVTETEPQAAGEATKGTLEKWVRRIWR